MKIAVNCNIKSANLMFKGKTLIGVIQKVSLSLAKMQLRKAMLMCSTENWFAWMS